MNNSEKHYLQKLLDYLKMSASTFAKTIGYSSPNKIYYILRFRNRVSPDVAHDITEVFQEISYNWLLTGEGEMLKETRPASFGYQSVIGDNNTSTMTGGDNIGVPITKTNSQKRILENESLKLKIDNLESKISLLETALLDKERIIEEKERMIQILLKKG